MLRILTWGHSHTNKKDYTLDREKHGNVTVCVEGPQVDLESEVSLVLSSVPVGFLYLPALSSTTGPYRSTPFRPTQSSTWLITSKRRLPDSGTLRSSPSSLPSRFRSLDLTHLCD